MKNKRLYLNPFLCRALCLCIMLSPLLVTCQSAVIDTGDGTSTGTTTDTGTNTNTKTETKTDTGFTKCEEKCEYEKRYCIEDCENYRSFGFSVDITNSGASDIYACTEKCLKVYDSCLAGCGERSKPEE